MMMMIMIVMMIMMMMIMIVMMITMMMMMIVIILMTTLKGAIRDFYNVLSVLRTVQNVPSTRPGGNPVQITCNTSSTYHMQYVVCNNKRCNSSAIKFDRV